MAARTHRLKKAEQSVGRGAADRVVSEVNVDWRRPGQRRRSPVQTTSASSSRNTMATSFTQLNHGWNAQPNAPHIDVTVDGTKLMLAFFANPYEFPEFVDGQIIRLQFNDVWRYAIGDVNDEGWYRGQC